MAIGDAIVSKSLTAVPTGLSERSSANGDFPQSRNLVLSSIPKTEYAVLRPHLEALDLPQYFILHEQGEAITHFYFPQDGMVSLVVLANDGRSVEVGVVGREGVIGLPRASGMTKGPYRAISQIAGPALRVSAELLESLMPSLPQLQVAFGRYVLMQGLQTAQTAACNRLHEIDQRLARWLLMCQDRVERDKLFLTHEFLAQMLGTGRPSVSIATGALERAGLIDNMRGTIKILDRPRLRESACECYAVMRDFSSELGLRQGA
jgi:CRP-like cAMP-binding protein